MTPAPRTLVRIAAVCGALAFTPATRAQAPATTPVAAPPATRPANAVRGMDGLRRLREAIAGLDLTAEQRQKLQAIQHENQAKREAVQGLEGQERAQKARELMEGTLKQVREILTPEQQAKLREAMQRSERDARSEKTGKPGKAGEPSMDENMMAGGKEPNMMAGDKNSMDGTMEMSKGAGKEGRKDRAGVGGGGDKGSAGSRETATAAGVQVGQPAPDLKLRRLDGRTVPLSSFKGKVLVLAFGSYSTPTFRDKATGLDQLAREYAGKASFLLVYTKEAHPVGGWEVQRNKQDDVQVRPHADESDRKAMAEKARGALRLTTVPIVVDTMDNAAADAFGALPAGVVVIGRDGTVVARQKWLEPTSLGRMVDQAVAVKATTQPQ
jgi:Spy/CpxP family protein refolding chaperone